MKYSIIPNETKVGIVKAVHDGDSIKVKFEDGEIVWIRLYGCDAPEVHSNYVSAGQPYGKEAGGFLRNLIKGKEVEVRTLFRDQFKRMICKVDLIVKDGDRPDAKIDLTEHLIVNGCAWFLSEPKMDVKISEMLKNSHNLAKIRKNGLWGEEGRKLRPSTWRERNRIFGMTSNPFEDISE